MKIYETAYFYLKIFFWILYFISFFGIWNKSPHYMGILQDSITIFTACILIYLFNPWFKKTMTPFHKKIAFDAGILILLSSSLKGILFSIPMANNFKMIIPLIKKK
jgi:hypothetical protein